MAKHEVKIRAEGGYSYYTCSEKSEKFFNSNNKRIKLLVAIPLSGTKEHFNGTKMILKAKVDNDKVYSVALTNSDLDNLTEKLPKKIDKLRKKIEKDFCPKMTRESLEVEIHKFLKDQGYKVSCVKILVEHLRTKGIENGVDYE